MKTKTVLLIVRAEVPVDVKDHRLANALRDAVVRHVNPDYSIERPKVTVTAGNPTCFLHSC